MSVEQIPPATTPISGTVTANAGTNLNTSALALSATQTNGNQKTQIVDGAGNVIGATTNALDVNIKSGNPTTIAVTQSTSPWVVGQSTAASLNATVVGTGTFATQATLGAGSAIVGKVGIDQTTPGTTNGVQVTAAIPAGSNVIGHVITDTGSTTAVTGTVTVSGAVTEATLDAALISQEATTLGVKGMTVFGAVTTAAPSYTNAKSDALSLQTNGSLRTAITDALPAGANVIGHVIADSGSTTAVTQGTAANLNATVVGTGTFATQPTIQAGTALIGKAAVSDDTSTIYNGTTVLTPKFVAIAASSSGNNTILAAVTSKQIRVLAYNFISNGTVNVKFQSGASGTDLTGLKYCVANMGICAPYNPVGWFQTAAGTLLNVNLSAGVAIGGELVYVEV